MLQALPLGFPPSPEQKDEIPSTSLCSGKAVEMASLTRPDMCDLSRILDERPVPPADGEAAGAAAAGFSVDASNDKADRPRFRPRTAPLFSKDLSLLAIRSLGDTDAADADAVRSLSCNLRRRTTKLRADFRVASSSFVRVGGQGMITLLAVDKSSGGIVTPERRCRPPPMEPEAIVAYPMQ